MAETRPTDPTSPDDAGQPLALVERLVEASVLLNRATSPEGGGLTSPLDVYIVLGTLSAAIDPLRSTLLQLHEFVLRAAEAAAVPIEDPDRPGARILADAVHEATEHVRALATSLRRASSGIGLMPPPIGSAVADYIEDNMMMEELE
ncbi:MAG TPA: hypothetical protein VL551_33670 [Actinospica sp.]|jgi:hypothetical protein|nr:hypothetical protein [Actinospica sp.]